MMWHYFPRRPLENRVLKTRFIIQNFFKNLQVPSLTGSEQRDSDQREGDQIRERNNQIREGEKEIAWVAHLGRANPVRAPGSREPRSRDPGRATQVARPGFARPRCVAWVARTQVRDLGSRDPHNLFLSLSLI